MLHSNFRSCDARQVAPVTANHIFNLVALGCYTTNHFFRVDKNFVAQNADVVSGRLIPLNEQQKVGSLSESDCAWDDTCTVSASCISLLSNFEHMSFFASAGSYVTF